MCVCLSKGVAQKLYKLHVINRILNTQKTEQITKLSINTDTRTSALTHTHKRTHRVTYVCCQDMMCWVLACAQCRVVDVFACKNGPNVCHIFVHMSLFMLASILMLLLLLYFLCTCIGLHQTGLEGQRHRVGHIAAGGVGQWSRSGLLWLPAGAHTGSAVESSQVRVCVCACVCVLTVMITKQLAG